MIDCSDLIGKPFANTGHGVDGYNCWTLAIEVFHRFGIDIDDYDIAADACISVAREMSRSVIAARSGKSRWKKCSYTVPALVAIYAHPLDPRIVNHVGVTIPDIGKRFIQATKAAGVHLAHIDDPMIRIEGFYRYE